MSPARSSRRRVPWWACVLLLLALLSAGCTLLGLSQGSFDDRGFSFIVFGDVDRAEGPEYWSPQSFLGACMAMREVGQGVFAVSTGDAVPVKEVHEILARVLGEDYTWYPTVGNHDAERKKSMAWLRAWGATHASWITRHGPPGCEETMYSFDFENTHFVILNEYYDGESDTGADGDVVPLLAEWLRADLAATDKPFIFVFGHEPINPEPDQHNGHVRHVGGTLDKHPANRDRFKDILRNYGVTAYFCGHTHVFSERQLAGTRQVNVGHAQGVEDPSAPSTFLKVAVRRRECRIDVYRDDGRGGAYTLFHTIRLKCGR